MALWNETDRSVYVSCSRLTSAPVTTNGPRASIPRHVRTHSVYAGTFVFRTAPSRADLDRHKRGQPCSSFGPTRRVELCLGYETGFAYLICNIRAERQFPH